MSLIIFDMLMSTLHLLLKTHHASLDDISSWVSVLHIRLNPDRTEQQFLRRQTCPLLSIAFHITTMPPVKTNKCVGVSLDNSHGWKKLGSRSFWQNEDGGISFVWKSRQMIQDFQSVYLKLNSLIVAVETARNLYDSKSRWVKSFTLLRKHLC